MDPSSQLKRSISCFSLTLLCQKAYHFLLFSSRRYGDADRAKLKNAEAALRDAKEKLSEVEKQVSVSFVSSE